MSKNIVIQGNTYNNVPEVKFHTTGGSTVSFVDPSDIRYEQISRTYTSNQTDTITPSRGYNGISSVMVTVAVPTSGIDVSDTTALESDVLANKKFHRADGTLVTGTIPTLEDAIVPELILYSDGEFDCITNAYNNSFINDYGLEFMVTDSEIVEAINSSASYSDEKVIANNIKNGCKILGVTGTYTGSIPAIPVQMLNASPQLNLMHVSFNCGPATITKGSTTENFFIDGSTGFECYTNYGPTNKIRVYDGNPGSYVLNREHSGTTYLYTPDSGTSIIYLQFEGSIGDHGYINIYQN